MGISPSKGSLGGLNRVPSQGYHHFPNDSSEISVVHTGQWYIQYPVGYSWYCFADFLCQFKLESFFPTHSKASANVGAHPKPPAPKAPIHQQLKAYTEVAPSFSKHKSKSTCTSNRRRNARRRTRCVEYVKLSSKGGR